MTCGFGSAWAARSTRTIPGVKYIVWLGPNHGGLWAAQEAAVDPVCLVEALRADAERMGARFVTAEARTLERHGDRVTGVIAGERHSAAEVVIAAGAWSGNLIGLPRPL